MELVKVIAAGAFLIAGMFMFVSATIGLNKFDTALNRIHATALGDTLGTAFTLTALLIWKGFSMASLKLLVIVLFFWIASPVSSHMLGLLEKETNDNVKQLKEEHHENN